jgi:hypothetical protein
MEGGCSLAWLHDGRADTGSDLALFRDKAKGRDGMDLVLCVALDTNTIPRAGEQDRCMGRDRRWWNLYPLIRFGWQLGQGGDFDWERRWRGSGEAAGEAIRRVQDSLAPPNLDILCIVLRKIKKHRNRYVCLSVFVIFPFVELRLLADLCGICLLVFC